MLTQNRQILAEHNNNIHARFSSEIQSLILVHLGSYRWEP
jgi:hypothetical protein